MLETNKGEINMNREMKFRGICIDDEIWKYGYLVKSGDRCFIFTGELDTTGLYPTWNRSEVLPKTVGQLFKHPDKNNNKIYEGDIVKDEYSRILLVDWWKCGFSFKALCETNFIRANSIMEWFEGDTPKPEIIGNIIQNPELRSFTPTP